MSSPFYAYREPAHARQGLCGIFSCRISKIIFSYANGSTAVEKLEVGYNTVPSGDTGELEHGLQAGEGCTITRWTNPYLDQEIASVRIVMTNPSVKLEVMGISTYLMREKVHD